MKNNERIFYHVEIINLTMQEIYVYENICASNPLEAVNIAKGKCFRFTYTQPTDRIKINVSIE